IFGFGQAALGTRFVEWEAALSSAEIFRKRKRRNMAKKPTAGPLLDLSIDLAKELKVSVKGSVHELIAQYQAFSEQTTGQKADKNLVVERGLEYAFKKDTAFQKFLNGKSGTKRGVSSAVSSAAASAQS